MNISFQTIRLKNLLTAVVFIAIPLLIGGLSSFLTADTQMYYAALTKPPLSPPPVIFPIVWTILYILMGIASYLVYRRGISKANVRDALLFYTLSLVLNFIWPLVFFRYKMLFLAFWVLVFYWLITGITAAKFYRIKHTAGILLLPLWLWITYAGYLNLATWLLNR